MSRPSRSKKLRRRPGRSLAATITAIILLAIGAAAAWFAIASLVTGSWPGFLAAPTGWLLSLSWNSAGMWAVAIVLAVIGIILLLTALIPGKFNGIRLHAPGDDGGRTSEVLLSSRAAARLATAEADRMDGVTSSKAKAKGGRIRVRVTSPLRRPGQLRGRVADAVRERLKSTRPVRNPKVAVTVRPTND